MIQQFRDVLRLRTAANLSEGREMIDYADYSKNPHTRTPIFGVQADWVLIYQVFLVKSA